MQPEKLRLLAIYYRATDEQRNQRIYSALPYNSNRAKNRRRRFNRKK